MGTYTFNTATKKPSLAISISDQIASSPLEIDKKVPTNTKVPTSTYQTLDMGVGNGFPAKDLKTYLSKHPEVKEPVARYIQWKYAAYATTKVRTDLNTKELIKINEKNGTTLTPLLIIVEIHADT